MGLYRDYIGDILGLYWGYIGIMEKKWKLLWYIRDPFKGV